MTVVMRHLDLFFILAQLSFDLTISVTVGVLLWRTWPRIPKPKFACGRCALRGTDAEHDRHIAENLPDPFTGKRPRAIESRDYLCKCGHAGSSHFGNLNVEDTRCSECYCTKYHNANFSAVQRVKQ